MIKGMGRKQAGNVALAMVCTALAGQALAGEYIVKFNDASEAIAAGTLEALEGAQVRDVHATGSLVMVDTGKLESKAAEAQVLARLMARPDVAYVVENATMHMFGNPNDPEYAQQWSMAKVRANEAWDRGVGSRQVTVAVIDTGVDYAHPDLADNVWTNPKETANGRDDDGNGLIDDIHGWDFLDNDKDPSDVTSAQNPGHGTHCSGIVGAVGDNGKGISGMAQQVAIIPLRFIGPNGQGDLMAAIKAIDYAAAVKADVISASWGAKIAAAQAAPMLEAIGRASAAGVIFVAAAANDGANNDSVEMYPANADFPNVIAVAASDNADAKPSWSNYGKAKVALASPGLDILSTLPGNKTGKLSGTSMATPLVAGLVALLKSQNAEAAGMTGPEIRSLLQVTGSKVAIETACMCRVDAAAAAQALVDKKLVVVPAAATYLPNATAQLSAIGGSGGYTFATANAAVVEVTASGALTAKTVGETTVKVTDSQGKTADSLTIRVAEGGGGGGGGEECPLGDPMLCELMCMIDPTLPWCSGL